MFIRSTQQFSINQAIQFGRQHSLALAHLQQQISTGLAVQRPSDDPSIFRSVIGLDFTTQHLAIYLENISTARHRLNVSVSQLQAAEDLFVEARGIAYDSRQSPDRQAFVAQLDRLLERLQDIANDRFEGNYLYSGSAVQQRPFEFGTIAGRDQGLYRGSDQRTRIAIGPGLTAEVLYSGSQVFQPKDRRTTLYLGNTGATAGSGTDSGVGFGTLQVRHVATSYGGTSGIAPGASSAALDTILGPSGSHQLTIDAVSGTLRLNHGEPITFVGTETDLKVTGPAGEVVYVNVTGIHAGFQGTVPIAASGTLSSDGGITHLPIDFSENQAVRNSLTSEVTFVDSRNIRRAGVAYLEYRGTTDAFGALSELRRELLNERNLTEAEWQRAITRRIEELERIASNFLDVVGQQSATLANLDAVQTHHEDLQLETRAIVGQLTSADLPEVITQMQARQNLLQTTYATTVAILRNTLVDFIR